jgi:phosphatidylglycerophosphatase A
MHPGNRWSSEPAALTTSLKPIVPGWRFLLGHPAHLIAFGFGAGLSPVAPGTVGTLVGFPVYGALKLIVSGVWFAVAVALLFVLGAAVCAKTGKALGVADHGGICWDEIVAFIVILYFVPQTWAWFGASFLVFRVFDIAKPFPIRAVDRRLKSGFGVMLDDLLAAGYSLIVLKVGEKLIHG